MQDLHRQLQTLQEHVNNIEAQHSQRIMELTATQRGELGIQTVQYTRSIYVRDLVIQLQ